MTGGPDGARIALPTGAPIAMDSMHQMSPCRPSPRKLGSSITMITSMLLLVLAPGAYAGSHRQASMARSENACGYIMSMSTLKPHRQPTTGSSVLGQWAYHSNRVVGPLF